MNKILLICFMCLTLAGCGEPTPFCEREYDPVICSSSGYTQWDFNESTFKTCMSELANARSSQGGNYTTHDDEDLGDAIDSCKYAAKNIRRSDCQPNPGYQAQQEFCKGGKND
jgi:hypothetical protein